MLSHQEIDKLAEEYAQTWRDPGPKFIESIKRNAQKLIGSLGDVELTDKEIRSLLWISSCENQTVDNLISAINKAKASVKA
ncbi:hypothetical protein [Sporomusa sphaeroides]|uniref:Uncharacterized protein n=1 Tax=Sporomusa sphaeroides DSM 2875 TaxID=1337886 RepID=A0A1U7M9V8_9FIRM|nr:hypothetical protein [Sporomusa sphaeroides]OLS54341.1 hypothetical protein SPSPH_45870 [Sporomusa sphaeroides DSM 2875]CVK21570.1 hypothetical protein SSPH_04262 [Sporomusa sphaeroides DSM 2875]